MASVSGASTGSVPGGGGAGGVEQYNGLVIPAGTTIPIRVGQGYFAAQAGEGGGDQNTGDGITGLVAIKIRRVDLSEKVPAEAQKVISGGTESVLNDYRYFKFTSDGTLTVTGEGTIEALVVGAGGGGGSDAGGGGGAGEVKIVDLVVSKDQDVVVGAGGAGGTSGGAGADGEDSSIGSMTAQGGGGGAGEGTAAGSRASGGGGHGDAGDPGAGSTFRANGGGAGGGYSLAGGGDARHAGGGGGVGAPGTKGATEETTGDPLADTWETPTAGFIEEENNIYVIGNLGGGTHRGLISELVNREDMFVQGRVISAHSNLHVGIRARGRHTAGGDDDPTEGWPAFIDHNNQRFRFTTYLFDLGSSHLLQAYVEDSLQEYAVQGPNGFPRTVSIVRDSNNDTTYNGLSRSFGFYCEGSPVTGTNKAGKCVHLACFASKWLLIGNAPSGGRGEVLNEAGEVVAEANESGGDLEFDLSLYGDGTDGTGEEVPLPGGFPRVRIYDSGDSLVVDAAGTFYPGGEFDVSGSSVEVRTDSSGAEPVPILGLLHYSDFSETTPGPELGDGGDGIELDDPDWVAATGIGDDDGYLGGGGGAGSEATIAGPGGQGGGGAGAYDTETPEDGEANTGGGGGGSGDSTVDGGDGGSGLVVVRSLRFDPDTVPEASRFSESALDQDNDGGIILDPATEQVTFGDNTAWNGLTAFTIVIRWQPNSLGSQRDIFSRHSTSPSLKRGIEVFQRQGTQFAALISSNGTDYAALWRNGGLFTGQDYIYAVVFDGSLTGGGNNKNRLRPLRLDGPMASWTDVGWDFEFYGSRSDVPASLATLTGVDELLGHRADGAGDPNPGVCKLLAIKYGTAYSAAELDAMDLYDEENIDLSDWDRLHRFQGHIADEIGSTDGTFTDPV